MSVAHAPGRNLAVKRVDWSTHEQRSSVAKVGLSSSSREAWVLGLPLLALQKYGSAANQAHFGLMLNQTASTAALNPQIQET